MTLSFGFSIYEQLAIGYFEVNESPVMFGDNIIRAGIYFSLCNNASASEILALLYISKLSNSVKHLKMIIEKIGLRHTKTYETAEYSHILIFMYFRLFRGMFVVYYTVICPVNDLIIKLISIGDAIQSYFYVSQMVQILQKRFKEIKERSSNNVSLHWWAENPKVKKLGYYIKSTHKVANPLFS